MKTEMEEYTVGQLARLSGVSVRTLHHYDDIGLLKPAFTGENGYRRYGRKEALRLQEILFYRAVGMPLAEVATLLDGPPDGLKRLERHRARLRADAARIGAMLDTLDATIAHLEGAREMTVAELYKPFLEETQQRYEAWLRERYGADMTGRIADAKAAIGEIPGGMDGAMADLRRIEAALVAAFEAGTDAEDAALHDALERHRNWIAGMWGRGCAAEAYAGLADLYAAHPDFVARYEALSPHFSGWLPAAMRAHAGRLG